MVCTLTCCHHYTGVLMDVQKSFEDLQAQVQQAKSSARTSSDHPQGTSQHSGPASSPSALPSSRQTITSAWADTMRGRWVQEETIESTEQHQPCSDGPDHQPKQRARDEASGDSTYVTKH